MTQGLKIKIKVTQKISVCIAEKLSVQDRLYNASGKPGFMLLRNILYNWKHLLSEHGDNRFIQHVPD